MFFTPDEEFQRVRNSVLEEIILSGSHSNLREIVFILFNAQMKKQFNCLLKMANWAKHSLRNFPVQNSERIFRIKRLHHKKTTLWFGSFEVKQLWLAFSRMRFPKWKHWSVTTFFHFLEPPKTFIGYNSVGINTYWKNVYIFCSTFNHICLSKQSRQMDNWSFNACLPLQLFFRKAQAKFFNKTLCF